MIRRRAGAVILCAACHDGGDLAPPTGIPDASADVPDGGVPPDVVEGHMVHEETHARLLVADADAPTVRIYEVDAPGEPVSLAVPVPLDLVAGSMGRWVYGLAPDRALLLDSGLVAVNHGEHQHLAVRAPRVLDTPPFVLRASGGTFVGTRFGQSLLFHRGDGAVTRIDELTLRSASGARIERHAGEGASDGLALPWRDGLALVARSDRVEVRDRSLLPAGASAACPGADAALANGVGAMISCGDGVVLATGAPELVHVAAPRIARLAAHPRSGAFFGAADEALARIDPAAKRVELLPLGAGIRAVAFRDESSVVALLDDGTLALFEAGSLASLGRVRAAGMQLAVDGDVAFVADDGGVRRVDLRTGDSILLPNAGRPRRLVLLRLTVNKGS